jgi:signal peptidase I
MNNDDRIVDINTEETTKIEKKDSKKGKSSFHLSVYDLVSIVMSAFIIIAVVFTFVFRLVGVSGYSMTNTLQDNDWLLTVNKESYERGDIVVITEPNYFDEPLIKRVIAKGGETVNIDFTTGTVYVDGVALQEPYTREDFILPKLDDIEFPYTVPEGHIFCMGDNRNGSTDSRSNLIGPLDERYVLGKAVIRILPFGDFDIYDYE